MDAPLDWYHSDYSLIDFHLHHPHRYTALWQIEYDVSLRRGSWEFPGRDLPFDLLVPGLKIRERGFRALVHSSCILQPDWFWWDKLEGHAATVGGFFPCIRITPRALDYLVTAYRGGRERPIPRVSVPSVGMCTRHARRVAFRHRCGGSRNHASAWGQAPPQLSAARSPVQPPRLYVD